MIISDQRPAPYSNLAAHPSKRTGTGYQAHRRSPAVRAPLSASACRAQSTQFHHILALTHRLLHPLHPPSLAASLSVRSLRGLCRGTCTQLCAPSAPAIRRCCSSGSSYPASASASANTATLQSPFFSRPRPPSARLFHVAQVDPAPHHTRSFCPPILIPNSHRGRRRCPVAFARS
ncbi:hypothetical protein BDU57DRAFT_517558 [Ampelomyces quisqualis]|uniref:Uncharacterized protein n=1 Tax=Ampelomyces quisqualis TaxID=50730 RepID=A0A6A5QMS5_AMPQU|nr:hypothetical protein BDU57DRAFT_517558 [Ampelomyces quisqualis]